jgi:molybdate transport system substrate-binding protein
MRRLMFTLALIGTGVGTVAAEEIRILSVGSLAAGLESIGEQYKTETGNDVVVEVGTAPVITERLAAGDTFDILITTAAIVEQAADDGQVDLSTEAMVGRVGIGMAIRNGVTTPNVTNMDEFEQLLLDADTVVYNRGSSGIYVAGLIDRMDISGQIESATTVYPNGGGVIDHVLNGNGTDVGLVPVTVIRTAEPRGLRLESIPDDAQNYTSYTGVVMSGAVDEAVDFLRYLTTESAKEAFRATGVD